MADVYLHVGLPKTGTTTIQCALAERAGDLAAPASSTRRPARAASGGVRPPRPAGAGRRPAGGGSLRPAARPRSRRTPVDRVVVSEEELGLCRPRQVHRVLRGLADHRVFVVSACATSVGPSSPRGSRGSSWAPPRRWSEFVAGVREPVTGPTRAAAGFAAAPRRTAGPRRVGSPRAGGADPAGHRPAARRPGDVLLARFARATDLPVDCWVDDPAGRATRPRRRRGGDDPPAQRAARRPAACCASCAR